MVSGAEIQPDSDDRIPTLRGSSPSSSSSSFRGSNIFHPDSEDKSDDDEDELSPHVPSSPFDETSSSHANKLLTEQDLDLDMRVEDFIDDTLKLVGSSGSVLKEQLAPFKDSHRKTVEHYGPSRPWDTNNIFNPRHPSQDVTHGSENHHHAPDHHHRQHHRHREMSSNINVNSTGIWIAYGNAIRKITDTFIRQSLPRILDASYSTNVSADCAAAFIQIFAGLRHDSSWVMKMFDSMAKIPSGINEGTVTDFGSYDQCLRIQGPDTIRGQYCLLKWAPPMPPKPKDITLQSRILDFTNTTLQDTFLDDLAGYAHALYDRYGRYGLCTPSACSQNDLQQVVDSIFDGSHFMMQVADCHVRDSEYKFDWTQKCILAVIFILLFIIALATTIEVIVICFRKSQVDDEELFTERHFLSLITCFSVYSNGQELLRTKSSSGSLGAVHGIRVISMTWLILTHTYLIPLKETFAFARHFLFAVSDVLFQLILNGWVFVDTFFCIGAMLATMSMLNSIKRNNGNFNILQTIFHRICRLSPNLWFTLAVMFLIPALGSGPLWRQYFDYQEFKCRNYWWASAFYFTNWLGEERLCLLHTWYLSADFQMFLMAMILFIIPLYWRPSFGITALILTILGSIVGNGLNTFMNQLPPTVIYNTPSEADVFAEASKVYLPTYVHVGPYCVGILLGYILHSRAKNEKRINIWLNLIAWLISIIIGSSILLATLDWNRGIRWSPLSSGIYAGFHRTCWSLVVAWITYACATGNGGFVNTFLSWQLFVPLSKLSYMVYLMHYLVLWIRYASIRWTLPFSHYTMLCEFLLNCILSTFVAIAGYLMVEAPISRLVNLYLKDCFSWSKIKISKFQHELKTDAVDSESDDQMNQLHVTNLTINGYSGPVITRM